MTTPLHEVPPAFDEADAFLHLLLGLASSSRRLDAHLDALAAEPSTPRPSDDDEPWIDLLLGLAAFSERFDDLIHLIPDVHQENPRDMSPPPSPRDILR